MGAKRVWKWDYTGDWYKVHCCCPSDCKKIARWGGCFRDARYFFPDGRIEWDVVVPAKLRNRAEKVVASPA